MKDKKKTSVTETQIVFLKGKRTTLRPLCEADIPLLTRWINNPNIRDFVNRYLPAMEQEEHDWLKSLVARSKNEIVLIIEVKGKAIGTMGIHGIDWKNRIATTGAIIGEEAYWGKGYGTDAKMALLEYAFNTLNLRKIMSHVKAFNKRSLAYSLHCGYKIEGRLRRQHFVNGQYWDDIVLGLFKNEWLPFWEAHMKKK